MPTIDAPTFNRSISANASSISLSPLALKTRRVKPRAWAAAFASRIWISASVPRGFTSSATSAIWGLISRSNYIRFDVSAVPIKVAPVTFPAGRLKLVTRPSLTGSPPYANTIGIVVVAAFAARAGTGEPVVKITETRLFTSSAARVGNRSSRFSAERAITVRLRSSTKPASSSPARNDLLAQSGNPLELSTPNVGRCCAKATFGHAADILNRPINSRRFIANPLPIFPTA